jgi:uncharacterized protein with beta-barrel porin domain
VAALGLMVVAPTSSHAQAPPTLGTVATFAVLGGSTVTNTGATILDGTALNPGNLGVSPGSAITGFFAVDGGPGILTGPGASIHQNDAVAIQAQSDLTTAYNNLAGRPTTVNLTGQNLGGLTLVPGVYSFSSSAQLTGTLTLNGLGNPNSVFIFQIGSTLTTASASKILLINGATGGNVFWQVGSSATLGTSSSFEGDILAYASITLTTSAFITCGAAWAETGAVTLDTNTINVCNLITGAVVPGGGVILGPTGVPLFASLLPSSASTNERSVANGLDTYTSNGGTLPLAFVNLFNLSPTNLANGLTQLSGEAGTGAAEAGVETMNSFLSLVTSPFTGERGFVPTTPPPSRPMLYKGPINKGPAVAEPAPHPWSVWGAVYGGQNNITGDSLAGTHDKSVGSIGFATGLDYRVTPDTVAGFALAGGGTRFGLSDGLGGGRSDMFQAAVYSSTHFGAAYLATALAYAWHNVTTDRYVTLAGTDHLTADFSANNFGGRIEGGYRFALPGVAGLPGRYGFTPYAAVQMQSFRTPSYDETAVSGSSVFALAYDAHTTNVLRTELGAWTDWSIPTDSDAILVLRARAAWAHDYWSDPSMTAMFEALPGSSFTVTGAAPARNLLLASAGPEIRFRNGISLAGWFDGEFAANSEKYGGTVRLRYTW